MYQEKLLPIDDTDLGAFSLAGIKDKKFFFYNDTSYWTLPEVSLVLYLLEIYTYTSCIVK